jgi:tetratricopeptide (TPR) repeat protein
MAGNGIRQSVCVARAARLHDRAGLHGDSRFRQRKRGFLGGMLLALSQERGRSHVKMALRHALLTTLALAAFQGPAKAQEQTETAAREALAMCRRVDGLPAAERRPLLEQGLELAERAIAARPEDPVAHFAAFCNRGKRIELVGLSPRVLGEVRRARRHIERTLELAPEWPEALAAKGALLLALPSMLGGDRAEGEQLLRRAVALDPSNRQARERLGQARHVGASNASDPGPGEG